MNSAETYVDIMESYSYGEMQDEMFLNEEEKLFAKQKVFKSRHTTWLSESGALEFFIFGAVNNNVQNGPKEIMRKLTLITGRLPLPPYYSFGFHYSKWENINAP